ncbi:alpha/beta fold hydrolase [Actinomadura decatromicini]|uniref:Alpha/beta hydrolase n=1 Tax=Actinomadura decatromicini TaxID=2604572 RepID=A0A5D3FG05_9ACTN|nr:alpha/beta hydrolase [Actinomadura decatromicini]TYK46944.1 alpha/beta hydrolase [Actinomadura decatromicini]
MNTPEKSVAVLVHGAFAESASWNGVIQYLDRNGLPAVAVGNPLRGLADDAAYVRDVIAGIGRPVVLVGHSYGGMVVTEAAAGNEAVRSLVYVAAFAPDLDESALLLSSKFEGSTLGDALVPYPLSSGGNEFRIADEKFHQQFCADVDAGTAALMAATQRPVTERALTENLTVPQPAWREKPSRFVLAELDRNIPVAAQRFMAERASSVETREIAGASHAVAVSQPDAVAALIVDAANDDR